MLSGEEAEEQKEHVRTLYILPSFYVNLKLCLKIYKNIVFKKIIIPSKIVSRKLKVLMNIFYTMYKIYVQNYNILQK